MLSKLIADRYLTLPLIANASGNYIAGMDNSLPVGANGVIIDIPDRNYVIEVSSGIFEKKSSVVAVANPITQKVHRNFRWLPYIPGKITRMRWLGSDILTGQMTGCWLVKYTDNGIDYAAHIGTHDDPNTPASVAVKNAWNQHLQDASIIVRSGWQPDRGGCNRPLKSKTVKEGNRYVEGADQSLDAYGLFARNGNYTVYLAPQRDVVTNRTNRIVEVVNIPTPPVNTLRTFPMGQ